jgi:hypothetical protein
MAHPPERDWMVVAPWWKWGSPHDPNSGRVSRPALQKYDTADLVNAFLKNPQRSLKFVQEDLVHQVQPLPPITVPITKPRRFSDTTYVPDGTNTRKIFRDSHRRFYLVVCQVHCDGPGFPRAARSKVCEAGFVVRRRTTDAPTRAIAEGNDIVQKLAIGRQQLMRTDLKLATGTDDGGRSGLRVLETARTNALLRQKSSVTAMIAAEEARLRDWMSRLGIVPKVQGWIKASDGRENVGAWREVEETAEAIGFERTFPLYPLIPPAAEPEHSGQFGTIYFGVLPTATSEITLRGEDRFDDRTYYEVRCFVRRHLVPHDVGSPCRCPERIFWSVPTPPYKIASHFDLVGTSRRPVTIQLPDIKELAAQAKPTTGVAFQKPPGYPMVGGTPSSPVNAGASGSFQICSFPIVLITIVASFVFEIFLPVVMLVFQLWWMLAFKFCIPPEVSLAAGLNAQIALDASASFEASIKAQVDASIDANFPVSTDAPINAELKNNWSPIAVANMELQVRSASSAAGAPTVSADLEWEPEVRFA